MVKTSYEYEWYTVLRSIIAYNLQLKNTILDLKEKFQVKSNQDNRNSRTIFHVFQDVQEFQDFQVAYEPCLWQFHNNEISKLWSVRSRYYTIEINVGLIYWNVQTGLPPLDRPDWRGDPTVTAR